MAQSRLINRNINAGRGRTSMRLEPELWDALEDICHRERITARDLFQRIEQIDHSSGRTSAVRVYIVDYFRSAASLTARPRPVAHADIAAHSEMVMSGP